MRSRTSRRAFLVQVVTAAASPTAVAAQFVGREDAPPPAGVAPSAEPRPGSVPPLPPGASPFAPGERLRYSVAFESITAGGADLAVVGPATIDNRSGLLVRYTGQTTGLAARVFRFEDRIDALLAPPTFHTLRYESWSVQRSRRRHRIVTFEPEARRFVRWEENGSTTTGVLAREAVDGLGLVYFLRAMPLAPGTHVTAPIYRRQDITVVTLGVSGPETVDTPAGRFSAVRVHPIASAGARTGDRARGGGSEGGLFGGDGSMWFTHDARRIPVRLVGSARFGSIEARLARIEVPPA